MADLHLVAQLRALMTHPVVPWSPPGMGPHVSAPQGSVQAQCRAGGRMRMVPGFPGHRNGIFESQNGAKSQAGRDMRILAPNPGSEQDTSTVPPCP